MTLEQIGRIFDPIRALSDGTELLQKIRTRLRPLSKTASKETTLTKDGLHTFLHDLLKDITENRFSLSDEDFNKILGQLNRSLEGSTYENDIFMACWNFWLQNKISSKSVLIIVDVQNDFIEGSLALKNCPAGQDGYLVIPVINNMLHKGLFDTIVYTQDWHPADHCSFIENIHMHPVHHSSPIDAKDAKVFDTVVLANPRPIKQKLWPAHCIIDTWGAELHKDLKVPGKQDIVSKKGSDTYLDSYSAFWNNAHFTQTDLFEDLLAKGITDVFICGLAFDYCVELTATDAAQHGFRTYVIEEATGMICDEGVKHAKCSFQKAGVKLIYTHDLEVILRQT